MRGLMGMAVFLALVGAVEHWQGAIGVTRLFGALFLCASAYGCVPPSIEVSAGPYLLGRLAGWHKALVLVPLAAMGLAVMAQAPALTCLATRYRHLCA